MLKGLAITPPIVGRISIGKVVEKNGKRLPEKDDEFTITTQVQTKDGWMQHPLNQSLRKNGTKLRSIPVRVMFNDPDLNLRASYHYFDRQTGRPLCVGNGETCKRSTVDGIKELPCPGPDVCHMGQGGLCKPYGRLNVLIGEEDELGSFIFRTTGHNSIRTLAARLKYFHAVSGGYLATLPMELRLRGKSTTQSHRTPIYYVDLTIRAGVTMVEAVADARKQSEERKAAGIDQAGLDEAAKHGFNAGAFEESAEEGGAVVDEFYPEVGGVEGKEQPIGRSVGLAEKLGAKIG
ncbi:MAG: hydrolase or metal-binding protein [Burkholderiaceae bacterium]|nr:hydrolase or metal-binding protein [Burkholderiaceae bacterium]